jgi:hypothetical protein
MWGSIFSSERFGAFHFSSDFWSMSISSRICWMREQVASIAAV